MGHVHDDGSTWDRHGDMSIGTISGCCLPTAVPELKKGLFLELQADQVMRGRRGKF